MKTIKVLLSLAFLAFTISLSGCSSESAPEAQTPAASSPDGGEAASSDSKSAGEDAKKASSDSK